MIHTLQTSKTLQVMIKTFYFVHKFHNIPLCNAKLLRFLNTWQLWDVTTITKKPPACILRLRIYICSQNFHKWKESSWTFWHYNFIYNQGNISSLLCILICLLPFQVFLGFFVVCFSNSNHSSSNCYLFGSDVSSNQWSYVSMFSRYQQHFLQCIYNSCEEHIFVVFSQHTTWDRWNCIELSLDRQWSTSTFWSRCSVFCNM